MLGTFGSVVLLVVGWRMLSAALSARADRMAKGRMILHELEMDALAVEHRTEHAGGRHVQPPIVARGTPDAVAHG